MKLKSLDGKLSGLLLLLSIIGLTLLYACQSSSNRAASRLANGSDREVPLKSLNEADNPFKDQYRAWDHWLIENLDNEPRVFINGDRPKDWVKLTGMVSAEGILLPQLETTRLQHERRAEGIEDYFADYPYRIHVWGHMDMEQFRQLGELQTSIRAQSYPPVPSWLAANPPEYTLLMPNGEVVTRGALGSGLEPAQELEASADSSGRCGEGNQQFWRYSAEGEALESSNRSHWWFMYFDNVKADLPGMQEAGLGKFNNSRRDGLVYFTDPDSGEIKSIWDWDATPLQGSTLPPPQRSQLHFVNLTPRQIQQMYKYQQAPIH